MKTAVITGASRGIGLAAAREFLAKGWHVVGTSTTGEIGIDAPHFNAVKLDYRDPKTILAAVGEIRALGTTVDVLVNNAAVGRVETAPIVDMDVLRETLVVNLLAPIDFTNRMLPLLGSPAHIINISSNAAALTDFKLEPPMMPAYKISKAALNMYTRVAGAQLRTRNITVSSLDPRWTRTDMGAVGGKSAPRGPDVPAREIYALATAADVATGEFWLDGKKRNW